MAHQLETDLGKIGPTARPDIIGTEAAMAKRAAENRFQQAMLQGVSRTFALTIPQLPPELRRVVANAYLLCRIADTIEDEPCLDSRQRDRFYRQFRAALRDEQSAEGLAIELAPLLSSATIPAEHELIHHAPRVLRITRGFSLSQRDTIRRCLCIMTRGMKQFRSRGELSTLEDLDQYCYFVAGVVGQMLTRLFCLYSPEVDRHQDELWRLSVCFGQGLQMTNILKDVWEDRARGFCWLPREVFAAEGFDLHDLPGARDKAGFGHGVRYLIGIAHWHLRNALTYTLLVPRKEIGIRKFCLWAIGFAILTLRKINDHLDYSDGTQVKISRLSVAGTMWTTELAARHDRTLTGLFSLVARRVPLEIPTTRGVQTASTRGRLPLGL